MAATGKVLYWVDWSMAGGHSQSKMLTVAAAYSGVECTGPAAISLSLTMYDSDNSYTASIKEGPIRCHFRVLT